jgi:PAS domain S-box-containing protein
MPSSSDESRKQARLRRAAETRLQQGTAPPTHGSTLSADALLLLHKFASAPDSAADALKLLHELQVHQVELDLQQTQLDINERELLKELAFYKSLYDFAPVAYLMVNLDGQISVANLAGVELFGMDRDLLCGRALTGLFALQSRAAVNTLLQQLRDGDASAACEDLLKANSDPRLANASSQRLRIRANLAMNGDAAQIIITEYTAAPHR